MRGWLRADDPVGQTLVIALGVIVGDEVMKRRPQRRFSKQDHPVRTRFLDAQADFGDYPMVGEPEYTRLYYPHNIDDLLELGVGDPRWSGCTPLIGAVISGQPSIVQYLLDRGARPDIKTKLGWTPLAVAEGVFFANAKKEYPVAVQMIRKAVENIR